MKKLSVCPAPPTRIVTPDGEELSFSNPLPVGEGWELVTVKDETDNDADKAFEVEAGYIWHILSVRVFYTADANAGDRNVAVQLTDNFGLVRDEVRAGAVQAATEVRYYEFGPALADLTGFRDTDWLMTPIPPTWILQPLHHVRVLDQNGVSIGGDDMHVYLRYARRPL